ncbi:MAG: threonine/serine exporter family protein [Ruthenibacterium sp.]
MPDQKRILELAVDAGETILQSGGEISRAQETMQRIADAYGGVNFRVYVLTNGIFASVDDEGSAHNAEVRHVRDGNVHLGRVVAVNALSREIVAGRVPIETAFAHIAEIRALRYTSNKALVLACGIGAACFSYLFGGTIVDAVAAMGTGVLLQLFLLFFERHPTGKIIRIILCAAMVAMMAFAASTALALCGVVTNLDKIIIGGIIPLVPGMALTTSIRDFANSDYLSGAIRMIDALLVAGSIAIGVGVVLKLLAFVPGVLV